MPHDTDFHFIISLLPGAPDAQGRVKRLSPEEVRHGHLNAPQLLINARVITKILSLSHKIM